MNIIKAIDYEFSYLIWSPILNIPLLVTDLLLGIFPKLDQAPTLFNLPYN